MDREAIIDACACAMGIKLVRAECQELALISGLPYYHDGMRTIAYDPLTNDAQCLALVKRFNVHCVRHTVGKDSIWWANTEGGLFSYGSDNHDLNRAVCECVANMQNGLTARPPVRQR